MSQPPDYAVTRQCHCLHARKRARTLTRLYEQHLRPHGLRATQFSVLAALRLKGPTPVSELAALLGLERTTMTRAAAVMQRNGWIEPLPSKDARVQIHRLSAQGMEKLNQAFPAWQRVQQQVTDSDPVDRSERNRPGPPDSGRC